MPTPGDSGATPTTILATPMKLRRLITVSLACGAALSGTACQLFQKKDAAATDPYGQAPAYGYGAGTGTAGYEQQPAANPYGQPAAGAGGAYGGYQAPATGGYAQPAAGYDNSGYSAPTPTYSGGGGGGGRSYTVVKGDNLFRIARQNNVSVDSLMRANNITNPNLIQAGQRLTIP